MVDLTRIEERIAQSETGVPALREDCAKEVVWADKPNEQTDWSVLFLHGFSATKHELRPLPDAVAKALGANLYFTRLTGHGQDGAAMGRATLEEWREDTRDSLAIARALGRKVLAIACSTGCTLAALALAEDASQVAGLVQVSPNYGLRNKFAQALMEVPPIKTVERAIGAAEPPLPVKNEAHARYWTTSYPISAIYPMRDAVLAIRSAPLETITVPTFVAVNPDDQVISPKRAKAAMERWGGRVHHHWLKQTKTDDKMGHIMAGDVFSPGQTKPLVGEILRWIDGL